MIHTPNQELSLDLRKDIYHCRFCAQLRVLSLSMSSRYLLLKSDYQNYMLDAEQAMLVHESQSEPSISIDHLLVSLDPDAGTLQRVKCLGIQLQNGFLSMQIRFGQVHEKNLMLQCQFLKKRVQSKETMISVNINRNPEFFEKVWARLAQFYHKGKLYLAMKCEDRHRNGFSTQNVCLAAFQVNGSANKLELVTRSLLPVDFLALANTPNQLEARHNIPYPTDRFLVSRGRVFSFIMISKLKPVVWIHCFHRNTFLPIGGATTAILGLYHIGSRRTLSFETYDSNTFAVYIHEICVRKQNHMQVHKLSKLYLCF